MNKKKDSEKRDIEIYVNSGINKESEKNKILDGKSNRVKQ